MKTPARIAGIILSFITISTLALTVDMFVGDLIEIGDGYIMVERENEDGSYESMTFAIDENTKFFDEDGEACEFDYLGEFDIIKVDYRTDGEKHIASTVTIMPEEEENEGSAQ